MTLKVGELYKARNGKAVKIVENLKGGLFRGDIGQDMSVIYRADGTAFTSGWSDWEIYGLTLAKPVFEFKVGVTYKTRAGLDAGIDLIRGSDGAMEGWVDFPEGRTKMCWHPTGRMSPYAAGRFDTKYDLIEPAPRVETDDRIAALEATAANHGQTMIELSRTINEIRERGRHKHGTDAAMAAKLDEIVERLDGTDRRVAALCEGLNDTADRMDNIERISEPAIVNRTLHQLATDITKVGDRVSELDRARAWCDTTGVYGSVKALNDRTTAVEQTIARIEDMLTAEEPQVSVRTGVFGPCGDLSCAQCYEQPKPRKSFGWVNVYSNETRRPGICSDVYATRADADRGCDPRRVACVEIFEGDGL
jgi:uncharacterized coiled-coil protein SlyX